LKVPLLQSEFSSDLNALISPKFRAVKIYAIREIRSQKIPLNGQEMAGSQGGRGWGRRFAIPKSAIGGCPRATNSK